MPAGNSERGNAEERLVPAAVRAATFAVRWRGLDPQDVYAYLARLADEVERLHREVTTARVECERIRQGLRQWRERHVGCRFTDPQWPHGSQWPKHTNRGPR
ncbi:DivIVA domain-containing protein [Micromonospora sp. NPDC049559]|uniref:DivIVA domain-containing protein n=1 Tax=Micromonospora sp. NPDC049559 TaxID=3155923 RepID=UPI00341DDE4E